MKTFKVDALYIHFPYCRHLCNYCDFYKNLKPENEDFSPYHQYLIEAFQKNKQLMYENGFEFSKLKSVYLGGGTPSLWGESGAKFLEQLFLKEGIQLDEDCEFTLEVNPGAWTEAGLKAFQKIGVNRYSLGIQSLNPFFLKALDRVHNTQDVKDTLRYFSKENLNFSVDFMLGLPFSEEKSRDVIEELKSLEAYNPKHFSLYILTAKGKYAYEKELPKEEWIEQEYLEVSNYLKEKNYIHYEVSNFSKKGYESIHNLKYWNSESVAALGPSATGLLFEKGIRYKWKTSSVEYLIENLGEEALNLEKFYMLLRTDKGVRGESFFKGSDLVAFEKLGRKWDEAGLGNYKDGHFIPSSQGYLLMDSLMDDIFREIKSL